MRALVSGSSGFVGRAMVKELRSRGYEVMGWDISEGWDVISEFRRAYSTKYDLVVHCAFHVGGRAAIDGQNTNFAKNLQLDGALFDWAIRTGQGRVLYFSSSAAYPVALQTRCPECYIPDCSLGEPHILTEDDIDLNIPELPDANYGWAKLTGERLAADARASGLPVTVVRPASGCSVDQGLEYPFPSIVRRAIGGDLSLWGNPDQVRDWVDIRDIVLGALAVADSGTELPVNLATGVGTSMRQLATMAFELANPGKPVPEVVSVPGPEGVFYRVLDPSRLHQFYVPQVSLEEMVREAVAKLRS